MRDNVGGRLDLEHLARACGLSRPHFFELFRRDLQLSPGVFWNMLRMEQALARLDACNTPLSTVAADLGFSAQSNFTRFFRDIQGVAPLEYRRVANSASVAQDGAVRRRHAQLQTF
ncbi:MAG: helix-turn-helix transcriptional regulator [Proteobacteria bacterium]|nr:helix-turn-helix transcriptional regulator [Burkholderiales bacterium]